MKIEHNFGVANWKSGTFASSVVAYTFKEHERVLLTKTLTYYCKTGYYLHSDVDWNVQADRTVSVQCQVTKRLNFCGI